MNNVPETIKQTLEVLSAKFGTSVEGLWEIMVKQQLIEARADLVIGLVLLGLFAGCLITFILAWKRDMDPLVIFPFFVGIISIVIAIASLYCSYMEFANPEYQAISEFLDVFKGRCGE